MSAAASKVSFTVRRPTPVSRADSSGPESDSSFKIPALPRHLSGTNTPNSPLGALDSPKPSSRTYAERDSSDEEDGATDELVTGFDQFGVQRLHEKPKPAGPLVIPALKNRDWRDVARKRKQLFVPPSAAATTGADGSVGGLGTRDSINSGPQAKGLQMRKRVKLEEDVPMEDPAPHADEAKKEDDETEDQRALRAILAGAAAGGDEGPQIDIIPVPAATEDDAYLQDVAELPESASLDDYERVPVAQFGAALLRGMGWKEGTAASRKNKGIVEPWLPESRPALLGIGAKQQEVLDDGSSLLKGQKSKGRPEKRYVPVVKVEKKREADGGERERDRDRDRDRVRDRTREGEKERDEYSDRRRRSPSSRDRSRKPSPDRDSDHRDRRRDDRDRDSGRYREREKDRDHRRDYDNDSSRRDKDRRRDRSPDRYRSDSSRRDRDGRR